MSDLDVSLPGMTSTGGSGRTSAFTVIGLLLVLSPVLVPVLLALGLVVVLLVLMVIQAFGDGFAVGCAALAALIGIPSVGLLWLSGVLRTLGGGRRPITTAKVITSPVDDVQARYAAGDFVHRDYEAEQREQGYR